MPNPLVNIGSAANDGTGELGPRGWLQKVNRLPISDSTINAGSGDYTGTTEQKITAAIAAAVAAGAKYVWVPQSMLPYNASLVTFNTAIAMIREGGNSNAFDVKAYGAVGDSVTDDTAAFTATRTALNGPGTITVPQSSGAYMVSALPTLTDGQGMWGPEATIRCTGLTGDALKLTGGWSYVRLYVLESVAASGSQNGVTLSGAQFANVEFRKIWKFRGTNFVFDAGGAQRTIANYVNVGQIDVGTSIGNGVLFKSGAQLVEGNGFFSSEIIGIPLAYLLRFGDNAGTDTARFNRMFGSVDGTLDATNAPIQIYNSSNLFIGDTARAGGGAHVTSLGGTGSIIISMNGGNLGGSGALPGHTVITDQQIATGSLQIIKEGAAYTFRNRSVADAWWMIASESGGVQFLGGANLPTGSSVTNNRWSQTSFTAPAALAVGANNDYAVGEFEVARLTGSGGGSTITGVAGGAATRRLRIINVAAVAITLSNQDVLSAAANRIITGTGANVVLAQDKIADLEYDSITARWRVANTN